MDCFSDSNIPEPRTTSQAEPKLTTLPHIYAGIMVNSNRPTQAMKAWVRHVYRTLNRRRYCPTPVIAPDPQPCTN